MSKTTNFKNTVEWLSQPKIAISLGIMVLIAAGLIWFFWDKIADAIGNAKAKNKLKAESSAYGTPTLTETQINSLASQIYNAMRGWGTDEAAVTNVLSQLNTNADYAALRLAYLTYNKSLTYPMLDDRIASEGTDRELKQWRNILQAKGINIYTF